MSTALVACSGVLQPKRLGNGSAVIAENASHLAGVEVFLRKHHDDPLTLAITLGTEHDFERIVMFAHSRGATFCCRCCEHLQEFGRPVDKLIFADGWNGSGLLVVPAIVVEVEAWIQSKQRPAWKRKPHGSDIHLVSSATRFKLHEGPINVGHNQIDELPEVMAAVLVACRLPTN